MFPMKVVEADKKTLNKYGLPDLPFVTIDPENTRYLIESAEFAYIKNGEDVVGFIVYRDEEEQVVISYIAFDDKVSISEAKEFMKEFSQKKEVFALTYDCNKALELFDALGFYGEPGLQYMELDHIPHYRSTYGLDYVNISPSKVPKKMFRLYNRCFSVTDGKETLEEFTHDPFAKKGNAFIVRREGRDIGFWIDVTYFGDMCFNCWIGIVPEHRMKGYGTQLMEYALTAAREKGYTKAGLLVNPRNVAAVEFYKQMGFEKKWGRVHFQSEPD